MRYGGGGDVAALPESPEGGCEDVYDATVIIPGAYERN